MINHQFHIPEQQGPQPEQKPVETPLHEALRIADTIQYGPEKQPEAYRFLNDAFNRIDSYFETALENDKARKRTIREKMPWNPKKDLTLNEVIDMTSTLVYGEESGRRFWAGNKNDHQPGNRGDANEEVAHWYFEQQAWLANAKPSSIVLHFETRPTSVVKWHNSIPHAPSMGELENLCQTIARYEDRVRERLSPLDMAIHDFEEEIMEEEKIVSRDTQEVMFSKQAVDRMIANYQAKKAAEQQQDYQDAA